MRPQTLAFALRAGPGARLRALASKLPEQAARLAAVLTIIADRDAREVRPCQHATILAPSPCRGIAGGPGREDFYAFVDTRPDEEHWELIEGELHLNAAPNPLHEPIVANVTPDS